MERTMYVQLDLSARVRYELFVPVLSNEMQKKTQHYRTYTKKKIGDLKKERFLTGLFTKSVALSKVQ